MVSIEYRRKERGAFDGSLLEIDRPDGVQGNYSSFSILLSFHIVEYYDLNKFISLKFRAQKWSSFVLIVTYLVPSP